MKTDIITPGIVFAIDVLLANSENHAAEELQRCCCITMADPADRAVVQAMKADGSIYPRTVAFIKKTGKTAGKRVRR